MSETTGWFVKNNYIVFELERVIDGVGYQRVVKASLDLSPGEIEQAIEMSNKFTGKGLNLGDNN